MQQVLVGHHVNTRDLGKRDQITARASRLSPRGIAAHQLTHATHATPTSIAVMEDVTMLEGSQGLFEELSFTIIPNGLSEERLNKVMRRVCMTSKYD